MQCTLCLPRPLANQTAPVASERQANNVGCSTRWLGSAPQHLQARKRSPGRASCSASTAAVGSSRAHTSTAGARQVPSRLSSRTSPAALPCFSQAACSASARLPYLPILPCRVWCACGAVGFSEARLQLAHSPAAAAAAAAHWTPAGCFGRRSSLVRAFQPANIRVSRAGTMEGPPPAGSKAVLGSARQVGRQEDRSPARVRSSKRLQVRQPALLRSQNWAARSQRKGSPGCLSAFSSTRVDRPWSLKSAKRHPAQLRQTRPRPGPLPGNPAASSGE